MQVEQQTEGAFRGFAFIIFILDIFLAFIGAHNKSDRINNKVGK